MLRRTQLKSKSGLKSKTKLRKKLIKKRGKRSDIRKDYNKQIMEFFITNSIQSCEAGLEGCLISNFLTIAHSKKSRKILSREDWTEVILACTSCHSIFEAWKPEEMESFVKEKIQKRNTKNEL